MVKTWPIGRGALEGKFPSCGNGFAGLGRWEWDEHLNIIIVGVGHSLARRLGFIILLIMPSWVDSLPC